MKHNHISRLIYLLTSELNEETISDEFNVATHECAVHANQRHRQGIHKKLLFNGDSITNDLVDTVLRRTIHNVCEQQTCKVCMETLCTNQYAQVYISQLLLLFIFFFNWTVFRAQLQIPQNELYWPVPHALSIGYLTSQRKFQIYSNFSCIVNNLVINTITYLRAYCLWLPLYSGLEVTCHLCRYINCRYFLIN